MSKRFGSGWMLSVVRRPETYTARRILGPAIVISFAAFGGVYYWGVGSPVAAIVYRYRAGDLAPSPADVAALPAGELSAAGEIVPYRVTFPGSISDRWLDNGRGVVLIGHSQGSNVLTQLVKNEIDGKPVQSRIISVLLLGTNFPVPKGKDVGGAFQHIPLCHAANQTGCVITYASFRVNVPPPANTHFGKVTGEGMISACTNPAALAGGSGELHSYLRRNGSGLAGGAEATPGAWVKPDQPITTPFVSLPGMLTAECVANDHGSYLAITVHGDPAGPRVSDITGDVIFNGQVMADWGLHLIDVNLAMGNLVDIVAQQSKAYLSAAPKK